MSNLAYRRGLYFEAKVQADLEESGYLVRPMRGSKGLFDLIALAPAEWTDKDLLIQVKSGEKKIEHEKWNELYDLAAKFWRLPVVADRVGRGIRYRVITGYHRAGSRDWPAEERTL